MYYRVYAFCNVNAQHLNKKVILVKDKCSVLVSTEVSPPWNKAVHGGVAAERLLIANIRNVSSHKQIPCK